MSNSSENTFRQCVFTFSTTASFSFDTAHLIPEASEDILEEDPFLQLSLPVTPKLQASRTAFWVVVTLTSRQSSSRDQLFAWATYCLVAVIYASGTNRPPRHTWMFYLREENTGKKLFQLQY